MNEPQPQTGTVFYEERPIEHFDDGKPGRKAFARSIAEAIPPRATRRGRSPQVTRPLGVLGNRYLVVTSDGHNQIDESDERDNTAVSAGALGLQAPDLAAAEALATASSVCPCIRRSRPGIPDLPRAWFFKRDGPPAPPIVPRI